MNTFDMINMLKTDFTKQTKRTSDNTIAILYNNKLFNEAKLIPIPINVLDDWELITVKRKLSGITEALESIKNGKIVEYYSDSSNCFSFMRVALKCSIIISNNVPIYGHITGNMIEQGDWYEYI